MTAPRVLVVDDDVAVAGLHVAIVEAHGGLRVVGVAHDGATALRLTEQTSPDLVLLDIHLPDTTGLEVLRRLRDLDGSVDVIAITAARELDTVRAAMAGGVLHYLVKPFTAAELRSRLDDYLHHRAEVQRTARSEDAELDQVQVDRLLDARRRPRGPRVVEETLPKGLSQVTMRAVRGALESHDGSASALEIGERVGISRVSARRYLEHLVVEQLAEVAPRYGAGRPENRYLWKH
ncbi:response regulator [Nocardioidaceae bacterium]|nr:response regulator [Nocardioidaceae bacterium]